MKKTALAIALSAYMVPAFSLTINYADDASLINTLLPGVTIKSFSVVDQQDKQLGVFSDLTLNGANNTQISLGSGLVLSTGSLLGLPVSNTVSNYGADLGGAGNAIIDGFPVLNLNTNTHKGANASKSHDAAVINIKFKAPDNVNGLMARFVYATEEFPEYTGTQYADGFALARNEEISWVNYATLSDGSPVSLFSQASGIQLMANGGENTPLITNLEFDGITRILQIKAPVTAGKNEEFMLVIADTGDGFFDSAVFISGLTFFNDPQFDPKTATVSLDDSLAAQNFVPPTSTIAAIPLPGGAVLLATGLAGLAAGSRRKAKEPLINPPITV